MKQDMVIVDIDGVIADYRLGLLWWINTHYPDMREICYHHLNRVDTWIDADSMGVSFRQWLEILENFRMSGGKKLIPVFPGARQLFDLLDKRKKEVVLLTSRPIDIYSNIYRDTVEWLRDNFFPHHLLLWSKDKADIVFKLRLTDRVAFAVDDEYGHCLKYAKLGLKTYWLDHYDVNKKLEADPSAVRDTRIVVVKSLKQITEMESSNEADAR